MDCINDHNGNHCIQKAVESVEPQHLQHIVDIVATFVLSLTTHPFGCQVIQRVLERCLKEQTKPITDDLINHVYQLILDDNVVEKCVSQCSVADKVWVIQEVTALKVQTGPENTLLTMLKDQYGNYVLQTMFNQAGLEQRKKLVARIKPYLELLNKHNFAKNIVFKIESEYSK